MSGKIVICPFCGKPLQREGETIALSSIPENIKCTRCGSGKLWRDGTRKVPFGEVQRYLCRDCGYRFSVW